MLFGRPFRALWLIALAAPLVAFAFIGQFSRYFADEYCTSYIAISQGVIGSVVQWYTTWSGRYAEWTLIGVVGSLGPEFSKLLPLLILVVWLAVTLWTVKQILAVLRPPTDRWLLWVVSVTTVFAVFAGIPSIIQSLYWYDASLAYTVPLIGVIFYVGYFIYAVRRTAANRIPIVGVIVILATTLITGGLSEISGVFQLAVTGLVLLASLMVVPTHLKRRALWLAGVGVVGAIIAVLLVAKAPGTAIRQAAFTEHLTLIEIGIQTVLAAIGYIFLALGVFSAIPLLICVIIPAVLLVHLVPQNSPARLRPRQARQLLALSTAVAFVLLMAAFAPSIYAASETPPSRVYTFPQVVLVALACCWGFVMGLSIRRKQTAPSRLTAALMVILLIIGPVFTTVKALTTAPQFSVYASEWDARDQVIRAVAAGGAKRVEVNMLTVDMGAMAALETIGPDADHWVNRCAEQYYGLDSLVAKTPLEMGTKEAE